MKTALKYLGVSILLGTTALFGMDGAAAAHFSSPKGKDASQVGGIVGNTAFFLYNKNDAANVKEPKTLNTMAMIARKQICEGKDTRMLVNEMKMTVMFVYPNEKDGSVTVITVSKCDTK